MQFDSIDACRARVVAINQTTPALNLTFQLTLPQCLEYCGTGYGVYDIRSVIVALTSWVLPLFLVLSNVTCAKFSSGHHIIRDLGNSFNWIAVTSQLLANPIDFLWSLCLKLDRGRQIKIRCDKLQLPASPVDKHELPESFSDPKIQDPKEFYAKSFQKSLSSVCFALDDFDGGKHVEDLLKPLEAGSENLRKPPETDSENLLKPRGADPEKHFEALDVILQQTARNLSDARRHNYLHAAMAVLIYGKEVFEALLSAELDQNFPYHMPHTLALRQLYYWLFLAIILGAATGAFPNQWTSLSILNQFLLERHKRLWGPGAEQDIILEPVEPWNGGNYSWRFPKQKITKNGWILLVLVILAVSIPVAFAFTISWVAPTEGLGDRGIMELAYASLWLLNLAVTTAVASCTRTKKGELLFRITWWWNLFWSLTSLTVLFAAFRGWFNNCRSWSAYYSRGDSGAVLNLNMKDVEERQILSLYLPMVIGALVIQVLLASIILYMNRDTLAFVSWDDNENRIFFENKLFGWGPVEPDAGRESREEGHTLSGTEDPDANQESREEGHANSGTEYSDANQPLLSKRRKKGSMNSGTSSAQKYFIKRSKTKTY